MWDNVLKTGGNVSMGVGVGDWWGLDTVCSVGQGHLGGAEMKVTYKLFYYKGFSYAN